jgi:hypothetical protein
MAAKKKTAVQIEMPDKMRFTLYSLLNKYRDLKTKSDIQQDIADAAKEVLRERFPASGDCYRVKVKGQGELLVVHKEIEVSSLRATNNLASFLELTGRKHLLQATESKVVKITYPKDMQNQDMAKMMRITFESYPKRNTPELLQIYREASQNSKKIGKQAANMKKMIDQIIWSATEEESDKVSCEIEGIKISGYTRTSLSLSPDFHEKYPKAAEMEEFEPFISKYNRVIFFVGTEQELLAQQETAKMFALKKEKEQQEAQTKSEQTNPPEEDFGFDLAL